MKEERLLWMWRFLQAQYLKSGEVGWCYSPGGTDVFRRIMDAEQYQLGAEIAVTLRAAASMDVDNCLGGAEVRMLLRGRYYEALEKGLSEITMAQLRSVMSVVFNKTWNSFKVRECYGIHRHNTRASASTSTGRTGADLASRSSLSGPG
ncbi:MAG: uncharacterized protein KVP18_001917 [Porospora cf. gigantea A]|uniref:uncharacterized protein n=1 Tax=Porospora cf. gigantea A TaxID=2853593 RepID=UPI0035595876|nr:MAG: hypothetical protein KVP18_001917 [Porospora cf. gigantea A]